MMKYLLYLLLFTGICNAQGYKNYTKVTAYRIVNEDSEGPCNFMYYMKREGRVGYYIQAAQTYNDSIAYNLLALKKIAKGWQKQDYVCNDGEEPRHTIINMFIIDVNNTRDTLFTSCDNRSVYFPKEQKEYLDPSNLIAAAFTKDIRDFYNRDLTSEMAGKTRDSITSDKITIGKKPIYGVSRKSFEANFTHFQIASTDSIFNKYATEPDIVQEFWLDNMRFKFGQNKKIRQLGIKKPERPFDDTFALDIDGVKVGDGEELLYSKYPNTTFFRNWGAPLENIKDHYYYDIKLSGGRGNVTFYISNKVIREIEINFWYDDPPEKKAPVKKKK